MNYTRVYSDSTGESHFVQLSGTLEVQVSDGQVRQFPPGSLVLLEDTTGKGDCTRVVGNAIAQGVFVKLPAAENATV